VLGSPTLYAGKSKPLNSLYLMTMIIITDESDVDDGDVNYDDDGDDNDGKKHNNYDNYNIVFNTC